jgi:hypothetical protein
MSSLPEPPVNESLLDPPKKVAIARLMPPAGRLRARHHGA